MRVCAIAVFVFVACAVGACSGDDKDDSGKGASTGPSKPVTSKDEQQVRAVLREALTTDDPDSCTRLLTQALLEQISSKRGAAAMRDCRKDADNVGAKSVAIDRVRVNGPRAGADVRPKGGSLTFKTLRIGLRKAGTQWRLDRLKGGTLDRAAFAAYARRELTSAPDAVPRATVDCLLNDIETTKDEAITQALLSGDPRLFLLPITLCGVRNEFSRRRVPAGVIECVTTRLRRELTTGPLGRRLAASPAGARDVVNSPRFERTVRRVSIACARSAPDAGQYQPAAAYP